jgi:hypothetical protein
MYQMYQSLKTGAEDSNDKYNEMRKAPQYLIPLISQKNSNKNSCSNPNYIIFIQLYSFKHLK